MRSPRRFDTTSHGVIEAVEITTGVVERDLGYQNQDWWNESWSGAPPFVLVTNASPFSHISTNST